MKILLKIIFIFLFFQSNAQVDSAAVVLENEVVETDSYIDYEYGYEIKKPDWLKVRETGNLRLWGGGFPKVNGIENAVYIAGFKKNEFESFKDFQRTYITGNKFGEVTLYSKHHTWYGRNDRDFKKIKNGVSSRVFTVYKDKIYHNQFVLIETSKAFLFINFCATPETYDENIGKFNEFLKGLKVK